MLILVDIYITYDFQGGGDPDFLSPLWIRVCLTDHMMPMKCSVSYNVF